MTVDGGRTVDYSSCRFIAYKHMTEYPFKTIHRGHYAITPGNNNRSSSSNMKQAEISYMGIKHFPFRSRKLSRPSKTEMVQDNKSQGDTREEESCALPHLSNLRDNSPNHYKTGTKNFISQPMLS
jgi:hypothetical protein